MRSNAYSALSLAKREAASTPGVLGVDYGFVYESGVRTTRRGIRFHVANKAPLTALTGAEILSDHINGVECDVIEARYALHQHDGRSKFDPLQGGISVGNVRTQWTGTLGAIVIDEITNAPGVLSNWHVLCGSLPGMPGDIISQPGPADLGASSARPIGRLLRWAELDHGYDAAIASLDASVATIKAIYPAGITLSTVEEPILGDRLVKCGRATGQTSAIVDGIEGSFQISYESYGDTKRWMDAIHLVPDRTSAQLDISLNGDSGAVWFSPTSKAAVALHFAGEDNDGPTAEYALAHAMPRVAQLLNIRFA